MLKLMAFTLAAAFLFAIASIIIGRFTATPPLPPASPQAHPGSPRTSDEMLGFVLRWPFHSLCQHLANACMAASQVAP
jgi:hypothetical protein